MVIKTKKGINKGIKTLLKKCKPYEEIDDEFKTYVKNMVEDPRVVQLDILHGEKPHGIAGFNEDDKIEYIWIFRNQRGQNLSGAYCNKYGVEQPTKKIMGNMIADAGLSFEEPYILMNGKELWNIKYGFIVTDGSFFGTFITYNEYNYGEGTFKNLESIIPLRFEEIDLFKLENYVGERIKNIGKSDNRVSLTEDCHMIKKGGD